MVISAIHTEMMVPMKLLSSDIDALDFYVCRTQKTWLEALCHELPGGVVRRRAGRLGVEWGGDVADNEDREREGKG